MSTCPSGVRAGVKSTTASAEFSAKSSVRPSELALAMCSSVTRICLRWVANSSISTVMSQSPTCTGTWYWPRASVTTSVLFPGPGRSARTLAPATGWPAESVTTPASVVSWARAALDNARIPTATIMERSVHTFIGSSFARVPPHISQQHLYTDRPAERLPFCPRPKPFHKPNVPPREIEKYERTAQMPPNIKRLEKHTELVMRAGILLRSESTPRETG